jgi:acyl-CoA hydrolase
MTPSPEESHAPRPVDATAAEWSGVVTASDLNPFGTLFGGRLAALVDDTAGHSAYRLAGGPVVTIAINEMLFLKPVFEGARLVVRTVVNRVFETSMEVGAAVWAQAPGAAEPEQGCRAYLTFVAVDAQGRKRVLPPVAPVTETEQRRYGAAAARRARRG